MGLLLWLPIGLCGDDLIERDGLSRSVKLLTRGLGLSDFTVCFGLGLCLFLRISSKICCFFTCCGIGSMFFK